jgi:hypothetical protein
MTKPCPKPLQIMYVHIITTHSLKMHIISSSHLNPCTFISVLFISMGLDYVYEIWQPTGLLFISQMIYDNGESQGIDIERGNQRTCSSATMSTTNPTWTDPSANLGLCGKRPVTNYLSHGPNDGGSKHLGNTGQFLSHYTMQHPKHSNLLVFCHFSYPSPWFLFFMSLGFETS